MYKKNNKNCTKKQKKSWKKRKVVTDSIRGSWKYCHLFTLILLFSNLYTPESVPGDTESTSLIFENTEMDTVVGMWDTVLDMNVFLLDVNKFMRWNTNRRWISSKIMNRRIKSINGNRTVNSNLSILHWNGGSRKWQNKRLDIELLLREKNPDMLYVSEANLWEGLDSVDKDIPGFKLYLPNTMSTLKHARLVLLAKDDLPIQILEEKTDTEAAMIWAKVGTTRRSSLVIGGIYRQHQLLGGQQNLTRLEALRAQENRWKKIVKKWCDLSRNVNCVVLGDLNLDYLRWATPEPHLENMVDELKYQVETRGFQQIINSHTRTWRQQADSLLDHIWTNCPIRTIKTWNEVRGSLDHNVIGIEIATKENKGGGNNVVKRLWKFFKKR